MSYLTKNYNRKKIAFKYGKGSFLYSTNGKKYLDFVQGIAVNSLGHAHPKLVNAVNKQSKKLWHVSNAFQIPEGEMLAKKLAKKTFANYVMFQNSGAEATEAAIKVARRYFYSIGIPTKNRILCVKNSFHGRTIAAIYASGSKKMTEGFGPKVSGFDHFEFGSHTSLRKNISKNTAAIMIETIMGEGGIKVVPDWCLIELRKICDKKNILLILDEVQCGIGRSGDFFAFEKSKVKPDIVPIAKGIGGGFPIGAVLMNKKVASGMTAGTHGSTFGGNPLACAVAQAALEVIIEENLAENAYNLGEYFREELNKFIKDSPIVKLVRGKGLLNAIVINDTEESNTAWNLCLEMKNNGLLAKPTHGNIIRFAPPLTITKDQLDDCIKIITNTLKNYKLA